MSSSHEKCPVCRREMIHAKHLARPCKIADNKTMSFLESSCTSGGEDELRHTFFQVSDLYGQLLFQKVQFVDTGREVAINYITGSSKLYYFPKPGPDNLGPPDEVSIDYVLDLDYPKLDRIKRKLGTLAAFL